MAPCSTLATLAAEGPAVAARAPLAQTPAAPRPAAKRLAVRLAGAPPPRAMGLAARLPTSRARPAARTARGARCRRSLQCLHGVPRRPAPRLSAVRPCAAQMQPSLSSCADAARG
ncbi:hypothetical protein ACFPRL_18320 [Pseudoclavibacter helvolus]